MVSAGKLASFYPTSSFMASYYPTSSFLASYYPEGVGEEDSSLLDPVAGEKEEGDMDDQDEKKLLREEVSHEDQEERSDEDKIRDFIGPDYRDKTDGENQNLSELNINSPKESSMSDDNNSTPKVKCQADANDSESYEISEGSNFNSTKPKKLKSKK